MIIIEPGYMTVLKTPLKGSDYKHNRSSPIPKHLNLYV